MMLYDPCCITLDVKMIDILMFWGFDHSLTDSLTHGRTTLVVKSLSRLKTVSAGAKTIPSLYMFRTFIVIVIVNNVGGGVLLRWFL